MRLTLFLFAAACFLSFAGVAQTESQALPSDPKAFTTESVEDMVLIRAERMPAWPGCENLVNAQVQFCAQEMLTKHIAEHTHYPEQASFQGMKGVVYVYYEVNTSGQVVNVRMEREGHSLFNKEALRVVKSIPEHEPGMQNGKRVRIGQIVPVHFPPIK